MPNHSHGKSNQIHGIDVLRFLSAMMVMWFYFAFWTGAKSKGAHSADGLSLLVFPDLTYVSNFGWVGVETFFVISGFVIAFSSAGATAFSFFCSRVVRLGPGVWICASIALAAALFIGVGLPDQIWRNYKHSIFFVPWGPWIDGVYWTLGIEVAFYALVFCLVAAQEFFRIGTLAIILGTASSATWFASALASMMGNRSFSAGLAQLHHSRVADLLLLNHGLYFAIGVLLWKHLCDRPASRNLVWISVFAVAGTVEIANTASELAARTQTSSAATMAAIFWVFSIGAIFGAVRINPVMQQLKPGTSSALKTLGLMTFPLYLIHNSTLAPIMGSALIHGMPRYSVLAFGMVASVVAAWIIATKVEPLLQAYVRKFFYQIEIRLNLSIQKE
jgi:peptidoglycan/LPS O-acetylase OafA/YrhL